MSEVLSKQWLLFDHNRTGNLPLVRTLSLVFADMKATLTAVACGVQDEHILARKYADRWMAKALGVGLFKRRLYRKEVEDTRQLLFRSLNPRAKVNRCCCLRAPWQGLLCCCFCAGNGRVAVLKFGKKGLLFCCFDCCQQHMQVSNSQDWMLRICCCKSSQPCFRS